MSAPSGTGLSVKTMTSLTTSFRYRKRILTVIFTSMARFEQRAYLQFYYNRYKSSVYWFLRVLARMGGMLPLLWLTAILYVYKSAFNGAPLMYIVGPRHT